jgi:hypothetical protein
VDLALFMPSDDGSKVCTPLWLFRGGVPIPHNGHHSSSLTGQMREAHLASSSNAKALPSMNFSTVDR